MSNYIDTFGYRYFWDYYEQAYGTVNLCRMRYVLGTVYSNSSWQREELMVAFPSVTNYLGDMNHDIHGISFSIVDCSIKMKLHLLGQTGWENEISTTNIISSGILNTPIDGVAIGTNDLNCLIHTQAYTLEDGWLDPVTEYNTSQGNGYAGWLGHKILAIRIWITRNYPSQYSGNDNQENSYVCPNCQWPLDDNDNCTNPNCPNSESYQGEGSEFGGEGDTDELGEESGENDQNQEQGDLVESDP